MHIFYAYIYKQVSEALQCDTSHNILPASMVEGPDDCRKEPQQSHLKSIVLRLGDLHIQMSFLGCIGYLMAGSGLQDVLELVYAKDAVGHNYAQW